MTMSMQKKHLLETPAADDPHAGHTHDTSHRDHTAHMDHSGHSGHMDHTAHTDHADHSGHAGHAGHGDHAGHSPDMFKRPFWISLILTIPMLYFASLFQELLGYSAPQFPGSQYIGLLLGSVIYWY